MSSSPPSSRAVSTGRGLVFITGAKLWFILVGYAIQFALPRALGSAAAYGVWVVVTSVLSPVNNVMVTATIQGVSKFTSEDDRRGPAVLRAALRFQLLLGGGVALAMFLLASRIAGFEHDPALTPYLQLATGVALAYSFYAVFVGAANGRKEFHKQAGLDVTFSTMRGVLIVGAAWVTHSALAAIGGFVTAAAVISVVAFFVVGMGPSGGAGGAERSGTVGQATGERFPAGTLGRFFGGVAFYLLIVNLLMFTDGLLLKRLVTEWATHRQLVDPAHYANEQAGFYGAVQNFARIPYQLILAVTFIIFPLVSRSTFEADVEKTRGYVRATMRYSLLVAMLLAAVLASRPVATLRILYAPEYAAGARALPPLLIGYVFFSLFNIAGTIINGAGRTLPTTIIGVATLAVTVTSEWIGIRFALDTGGDALYVAAVAAAGSMGFGLVLSGIYLWRSFGAFLPLLSVVRTALCYGAALAVGWGWDRAGLMPGKLGTIVSVSAAGLAFVAVALLSGELRPAELLRLRRATKS